MSNKNKKLAMWGFYLLIGVLLAFAASRTLHFVQTVMSNATQGYMFLFATGLGALIWLYVYLAYAEGSSQRAIAFAMSMLDLAAELALVYADMKYVGDQAGMLKMTENEMNVFFVVSVLIVGVNIAAGWLFKLADLTAQQEQHAQDLVDHVTDATLKHLNTPEAKAQLVQELLPTLRDSIAARVSATIFDRASHHDLPSKSGLDARAAGWPLPEPGEKKEQTVPFLSGALQKLGLVKQEPASQMNDQMVWTTDPEGNRRRVFCMKCQSEGKPWYTAEPCEHILNAQGQPGDIQQMGSMLRSAFEAPSRESDVPS